MSKARAVLAAALTAVMLSACGGGDNQEEIDAAVAKALASQEAEEPAPAPSPAAAEPGEAPAEPAPAAAAPVETVDFAMPDFRGENLQVAQDKVQELGVFFSVSHDLLGARNQLLDSNWQVCSQTPAAGTQISGPAAEWEGKIDFGSVKLTENCP